MSLGTIEIIILNYIEIYIQKWKITNQKNFIATTYGIKYPNSFLELNIFFLKTGYLAKNNLKITYVNNKTVKGIFTLYEC